MEFSDQIKTLRKENNLTQEQFASRLHVTRQAVSNWENNKNLPDIETLILISSEFHVSLDKLILGGSTRNKMTEKLVRDGSETRRARMNLISTLIGTVLMLIGFLCLFIKANSVEYIDSAGILHENFYLIPCGMLSILTGAAVILLSGAILLVKKHRENKADPSSSF